MKWLLVILVISLFAFGANAFDLDAFFKSYEFNLNAEDPMRGPLGFVLLSTALISISCPRQIVSFFAAYFFGLWWGIGFALLAMTLSCILTFFIGNLFKNKILHLIKGKINLAVQFWRENTFITTVIWRFVPAGSNLLTNLAAGALNIPAFKFIAGSALGYIPHTIIFAMLGSGFDIQSGPRIAISIALFAIAIVLGVLLYKRFKQLMNEKQSSA